MMVHPVSLTKLDIGDSCDKFCMVFRKPVPRPNMVETVVGWPLATTFCPTRHLAWQHYLTGSDIMKRVLSNTENDPTKGLVKSALQDWSVEGLIVLTRTSPATCIIKVSKIELSLSCNNNEM